MALLFMRFEADMPSIMMGETGIGKTALIILLSKIINYKLITKDVHAGVTKEDIIKTV
jgi:MoxR-like ATPase